MPDTTEPKYYKIIGPTFCFRDICPYNIDVLHIPNGTIITSPFECQGDEYDQNEHWNLDLAYIHFAKGAFNTIMWYNWLFQNRHIQNNQIYRIQPLDKIVCDRCIDKAQLFQCDLILSKFWKNVIYKKCTLWHCKNIVQTNLKSPEIMHI